MMVEVLENRWMELAIRLGADKRAASSIFDELVCAYQSEGRHYHTLTHIYACLDVLEQYVPEETWTDTVRLSVWWHDFVYNPAATDNEDQSREALLFAGRRMHLNDNLVRFAADMILATKHDGSPYKLAFAQNHDPGPSLYLVDVDLSILGASAEEFDTYESQIRAEYSFVPDALFKKARSEILHRMLSERQTIYFTPTFRHVFEDRARENLKRSIEVLSQVAV